VEQGLRRIRAGACSKGILALLRVSARPYQNINAQDLGFYVGPRLNAAGRLDDMTVGIQCLLAETESEATRLAQQLHELNLQRRGIEADMQDSANYSLENLDVASQYTISLYQSEWHQGVIGILASRIKEQYHRPVIVFADAGDGLVKGSGRSIASLHLRDALDHLSKLQPDLILKFGGHAMAAGLTIRQKDFERFRDGFESVVRSLINKADLESILEVDGSLHGDDFNIETAHSLENQVWGQGFAPPVFFDTFEVISQRVVGEKHLKLNLKLISDAAHPKAPVVDAIYFNQRELVADRIKAAYQLQTNEYNGTKKVQLSLRYVVT
jgi:single-stranded-DNA-specific exonuclease